MKIFSLGALAILIVAAGCSQVPRETAQRLDQKQQAFKKVQFGVTKADLLTALGPPQKEEDRICYWEASYGRMNRESLKVTFDGAGKAVSIETKHIEANRPPTPTT